MRRSFPGLGHRRGEPAPRPSVYVHWTIGWILRLLAGETRRASAAVLHSRRRRESNIGAVRELPIPALQPLSVHRPSILTTVQRPYSLFSVSGSQRLRIPSLGRSVIIALGLTGPGSTASNRYFASIALNMTVICIIA